MTHAPPEGLGDGDDPAHWGFRAIRELLDKYHPKYLLHGHVHLRYGFGVQRELQYQGTTIINTYERFVIDYPDQPIKPGKYGQLLWQNGQPQVTDLRFQNNGKRN